MPHGRGLPSGERPSHLRGGHDRRPGQSRSCLPGCRALPEAMHIASASFAAEPLLRATGTGTSCTAARSTCEGGRGGFGRAGRASRSGAQRRTGGRRRRGRSPAETAPQTCRVCKGAPFSPSGSSGPRHPGSVMPPFSASALDARGSARRGSAATLRAPLSCHPTPSEQDGWDGRAGPGRAAGVGRSGLKVNSPISRHPSHLLAPSPELVRCGL